MSLAKKYPKYYKAVPPGVDPGEVDTYVLNMMFPVADDTGCILHARKKLLIPGVRSGGKSMIDDVREARDTLNRYLALMEGAEGLVGVEVEEGKPEVLGREGWTLHTTGLHPEDIHEDALVDVIIDDTHEYSGNFAKPMKNWKWMLDGRCAPITHYRLTKIEQAKPDGPDGWKEVTGPFIPDGLDPDEMVEVRLENGHEMIGARRADKWNWEYRRPEDKPNGQPHISAWRRYRHNSL